MRDLEAAFHSSLLKVKTTILDTRQWEKICWIKQAFGKKGVKTKKPFKGNFWKRFHQKLIWRLAPMLFPAKIPMVVGGLTPYGIRNTFVVVLCNLKAKLYGKLVIDSALLKLLITYLRVSFDNSNMLFRVVLMPLSLNVEGTKNY
ncbi:hypothetical protein TNIN_126451 [Trichonephila inaurata madagascariensis]|uniref:Uncharacterized protein n=1 Tax=Trichonephila inaurata madagascariensis TaxID=2747483 RepID=A0A8X6WWQ4_9ARAC|nr:hypothetical protein TNIN_126451 [Trichonephila inaurata madagascariensis]